MELSPMEDLAATNASAVGQRDGLYFLYMHTHSSMLIFK